MHIYLGNLTVEQIESESYGHSIKFTEEEREFLNKHHHSNAAFTKDSSGWHMFDMPRFLQISHDEVGEKVIEIFKRHSEEMTGIISFGYAPETVVD